MLSYEVTDNRSWWEWLRHARLAFHSAAGELEQLHRTLDEQNLSATFRTAGLSAADADTAAAAVRAKVAPPSA
jgi:hypothetical protein